MITLYDDPLSGNGYKVRLLLARLQIPYRLVELDVLKKETRTPAFLAKNPNGRIPTIEFEDGRCLSESDAILFYFAQGTPLWPDDRFDRADVLRWMFFEQYSHEPYVAVARFMHHQPTPPAPDLLREKHEKGYAALDVMEGHLANHDYLAANPLHDRRYRPLRLHPRRRGRRFRPDALPQHPRLARPGGKPAGPRAHGSRPGGVTLAMRQAELKC